MDRAKIKKELEKLAAEGLPAGQPQEEAPVVVQAEGEGEDKAKAKAKKEEDVPRKNGLIETDYAKRGAHLDVQINPDQVVKAAELLDSEGMTIDMVTGVDWIKEGQFEIIYDYSYTAGGPAFRVVVRARVDRNKPDIPTISHIYGGANWHERETWELLGINFVGHPQLEHFLLPEDADFFPLRKDFKP
ncbi:MAG: NADH-quinone oxidoreductase subunit C [Desulfurivibrio sp.]|nr:MAG: NADH-quinone oxidoreductase subunit C [Desulfurivibrio sp.]